ncbi:hypothetical protein [Salinicoccus albus]|uniref:hypothetical protein n=1 Tax=Salinicoccus albus TaxID=418756 RepID=UPI0003A744B7|nr:hypothetical protein [Salinicoccus albus]
MKKRMLLSSLFVAGALTVTGMSETAQANEEEEGAKTLWGEILPAETDPDGDGWANMGFDPSWMPQDAQDEISDLTYEKDFGNLSQVEYNEAVAEIYQREMDRADDADLPEHVKQHDEAKSHGDDRKHSEKGYYHKEGKNYWDKEWYDEINPLNVEVTKEKMAYLAMHEPEKLNSGPLQEKPYDYHFHYKDYKFNFSFDGTHWKWSYDYVK